MASMHGCSYKISTGVYKGENLTVEKLKTTLNTMISKKV
jgi:hypothetical protein